MKKQWIITGVVLGLLVIAGVCYSCTYHKDNSKEVQITSLKSDTELNTVEELEVNSSNKPKDDYLKDDSRNGVPLDCSSESTSSSNTSMTSSSNSKQCYVHICGAVENPGVYQANDNARWIDIILMAGGLKEEAAGDYINQAATIYDGQRIFIPTKEELRELSLEEYIKGADKAEETEAQAGETLVNINKADASELMTLTGIGQSKANSILEYRKNNGEFKVIEDLMKVPGIKEGLFKQISAYITVD